MHCLLVSDQSWRLQVSQATVAEVGNAIELVIAISASYIQCMCCSDQCQRLPVREATVAEVTACHGPGHMGRVAAKASMAAADAMTGGPGRTHFSPDTYLNQHTLLCARLAAGACADTAVAVVRCVHQVHTLLCVWEVMLGLVYVLIQLVVRRLSGVSYECSMLC